MKTILLLCLAAISASGADLPGWKQVWADEFDQAGHPNPEKWSYEKGLIRNNEKQYYTEKRLDNARVEDGRLILEARREAMNGGDFTSASVITKGKGEWTFGRIDVRAKLPSARGTWPAIWMLPADHGKVPWPLCGEIDIMEHVGHDPGKIHGTLHSGAYNHTKGTQRSGQLMLPTFATQFHVYSLEWAPERIVTKVDGKTSATFEKKPGDGEAEWPFEKSYYLILNLAIGGAWGGQKGIDETAFPQRMEVDYVRVYRKE